LGLRGRPGRGLPRAARTSTPEELFRPVSLKALEQDSYRRKTTGMLPEARVAFIDEVFKANSAVLNGLLSVLNERIYFNDGEARPCPWRWPSGPRTSSPPSARSWKPSGIASSCAT
jgi:MoxR-like ATPase